LNDFDAFAYHFVSKNRSHKPMAAKSDVKRNVSSRIFC
jgi:hypothetical protein